MARARLAKMAWRNLWRNRRRTLLTLLSIAFGTFLAVMFTATQDRNFADMIDTMARLGAGHVTVQSPDYLETPALTRSIHDSEQLRELAETDRDVSKAVTRISGSAMLATATESYGAFFVAYDPRVEDESTLAFTEGLIQGELFSGPDDKGIVLGTTLAENLKVELGDKVVYTLLDRGGEISAGMGRLRGIVRTGTPSVDAGLFLLPIGAMRKVVGYDTEESTQVAVFLSDSRRSGAVAERLRQKLPEGATALPWDEIQPDLSGFIAMKVGGARFMELVIMVLVAAGIFNTLFVSVMERLQEFGIMMAIGFSPRQLFGMVMLESLFLALVGLVLGAAITTPLYLHLQETGIDVSAQLGNGPTEVAGVGFDPILKVGVYPENLVLIAFFVVGATLLSGVYPAWRAGRVVPVESIKLV